MENELQEKVGYIDLPTGTPVYVRVQLEGEDFSRRYALNLNFVTRVVPMEVQNGEFTLYRLYTPYDSLSEDQKHLALEEEFTRVVPRDRWFALSMKEAYELFIKINLIDVHPDNIDNLSIEVISEEERDISLYKRFLNWFKRGHRV
jgi:hypothetical protein